MNYYEILYIVNPKHGKEKISEIIHDINKHIEAKKHSVLDHNFWGKKQLAYNINKEKYGNYVLLHTEFNDSNFVNDFLLDQILKLLKIRISKSIHILMERVH